MSMFTQYAVFKHLTQTDINQQKCKLMVQAYQTNTKLANNHLACPKDMPPLWIPSSAFETLAQWNVRERFNNNSRCALVAVKFKANIQKMFQVVWIYQIDTA